MTARNHIATMNGENVSLVMPVNRELAEDLKLMISRVNAWVEKGLETIGQAYLSAFPYF